jgi:protein-serine/threonine kinase
MPAADDTAQSDADAPDGSDIPPLTSVPLPPPESGTYTSAKEPGHTLRTLQKLVLAPSATATQTNHHHHQRATENGSSPEVSESDWSSPVSTREPSRAPSVNEAAGPSTRNKSLSSQPDTSTPPTPFPAPKAPEDTKHKFHLKDLLASAGPKLNRKSSARSTGSSKKSDSDGERRSANGESVGSLSSKYGVCQKVAIGKGATSVVRLAHKWDRTEEKLYAIKVRSPPPFVS